MGIVATAAFTGMTKGEMFDKILLNSSLPVSLQF
jgi:hypothetical protein